MGRPKATKKQVTVCVIENPTGTEVATQATQNISVTFDTTIYQNDKDKVTIERIVKTIQELHPNARGSIHVHTSSKGKKLSPPLEDIWDNIGKSKLYAVLDGNLQESAAVTINDDDVEVLKGLPKVEAVPVGPVPSQQDEKTSLGEKRLASLINEAVESLNVVANSLPTRSDAAAQVAQLLSGAWQVFKSLSLDGRRDVIDVAADITNVTTKWLCEIIDEHVFEAQIDLLQGSLGKHLVLEAEPTLEAQELKPDEELSMAVEDIIKQTGGVENMDFELSDLKPIEDKADLDSEDHIGPFDRNNLDSEDNIGSFDRNSPFPDSINHDGPTMPLAPDANFLDNLDILPQSGFTGDLDSEDHIGPFDRNSPFPDSINPDVLTMPPAQDADCWKAVGT